MGWWCNGKRFEILLNVEVKNSSAHTCNLSYLGYLVYIIK
jgi:hypothetical protein